jgi:hypothetical protein
MFVKLKTRHGQHLRHVTHIGFMNGNGSTQMALVLGCLLGQNVTLEGLTPFNGPTRTNSKALFSAAFCFHFGHF